MMKFVTILSEEQTLPTQVVRVQYSNYTSATLKPGEVFQSAIPRERLQNHSQNVLLTTQVTLDVLPTIVMHAPSFPTPAFLPQLDHPVPAKDSAFPTSPGFPNCGEVTRSANSPFPHNTSPRHVRHHRHQAYPHLGLLSRRLGRTPDTGDPLPNVRRTRAKDTLGFSSTPRSRDARDSFASGLVFGDAMDDEASNGPNADSLPRTRTHSPRLSLLEAAHPRLHVARVLEPAPARRNAYQSLSQVRPMHDVVSNIAHVKLILTSRLAYQRATTALLPPITTLATV